MKPDARFSIAEEIMLDFAGRTGLSPAGEPPRRYLWTDAFAVCNYLELHRRSGAARYRDLALLLVDQVHHVLGRHRPDDSRSGWISGMEEREGEIHPTVGGLRIGKKLNERGLNDRLDERLEWDRDGQYYHYLTKWMHALSRVSRVTEDPKYNTWAVELARTAHRGFLYAPSFGGRKMMYWKMNIDLSAPLVRSMGQHDPLDGFITYNELAAGAAKAPPWAGEDVLGKEIADIEKICLGKTWTTDDPLGIGGLLFDAFRVVQLMTDGSLEENDLLTALLEAARAGLNACLRRNSLELPADYRLAFRELGLSIGLKAIDRLWRFIERKPDLFRDRQELRARVEALMRYTPLVEIIEGFWLDDGNRQAESWTEHEDINSVMLATSLIPDGFLTL
ncbi:MAG TPA: hypothetical protein PK250_06315 [Syntrophobacter fumaroxidans]|nr:hypothetical protein [Syntrophobacter fumaroxidans]